MPSHLVLLTGDGFRCGFCREVLERAGYRVRHVLAAAENVPAAGEEELLGIVIGAAGGEWLLRLVRLLRLHPGTARVPILVLSEHADDALEAVLLSFGGLGWLREPFSARRLLHEVQYLTSRHQSRPGGSGGRPPAERDGSERALQALHGNVWRDERMRRTWEVARGSPGQSRPATKSEHDRLAEFAARAREGHAGAGAYHWKQSPPA
jgi:DNA-binding response OmpR family regulator